MAGIKVFLDDSAKPRQRKLFCCVGSGHYIGSRTIVVAWNKGEAERQAIRALRAEGIRSPHIYLTEEITESVAVVHDGDY